MKRNYASKFSVILALATLLLLSGCYIEVPNTTAVVEPAGDQQALEEEVKAASQVEEATDESLPRYYTSQAAHERLGMIDLDSGDGADVGSYQNPEVEITRTAWAAANGAIYEDEFYTILNKRLPSDAEPDQAEAHLAKVNMATGEAELLGSLIHLNLMGLEINPCGEMFATGFTLSNALGEWYGDTNLYRVDPQEASLTLIGDTGIERIMDLAFDPAGTLWATVGNVLYTLDPETGAATEMAAISGVENDNEIMGIAFTGQGEMFATTPFSDGFYRLDPASGAATEVGRHGFTIVHGGDIPMVSDTAICD